MGVLERLQRADRRQREPEESDRDRVVEIRAEEAGGEGQEGNECQVGQVDLDEAIVEAAERGGEPVVGNPVAGHHHEAQKEAEEVRDDPQQG